MTMTRKFKHKDTIIWSHGVEAEEQIDRLSDLPDYILEHILSLVLDSKSLVQTCILSKRWRCLWKAVPALNFSRTSFDMESSFTQHVQMYLALRFHSIAVGSITFDFGPTICQRSRCIEMFDCVMRYATAARSDQLHHLSISCAGGKVQFSDIVASITPFHVHESLKVLELKGFRLDSTALSSSLGFKSLTTLELHHCRLRDSALANNPLANLPASLNNLKLNGCVAKARLQISAPQLLVLDIQRSPFFAGVELFAPKLESFSLGCSMEQLQRICQLNFPCMDHADIRLWGQDRHNWDDHTVLERFSDAYINLLRGLRNVESLILRFDRAVTERPCHENQFPFSRMKALMKSRKASSWFTRLKALRMQCPRELWKLPIQVFQVFRYFLQSSGEKVVRFEWGPK